MCYSAAPSTTNQNATQRIYIKDIKWLGNPYRHTVLKCSMKLYLKVIGCSCYTCLPRTAPAAAQFLPTRGSSSSATRTTRTSRHFVS